jgi:universal stress protein A
MSGYKHILLATDLSEKANQLAAITARLAKRSNAKLSIVHVMEYTPVVYGGGEFSITLDMSLEEHLANNARQALSILAKDTGISTENQYVYYGSIKKEIIELAENLKVDLIVVGSHGRSGIDFILGSTANAILHSAKCDVLAIRVKNLT